MKQKSLLYKKKNSLYKLFTLRALLEMEMEMMMVAMLVNPSCNDNSGSGSDVYNIPLTKDGSKDFPCDHKKLMRNPHQPLE